MKAGIYYQMIVGNDFTPDGWAEDLKDYRLYADNAALRQAKTIVSNFNDTLKVGEEKRTLLRVEKVDIRIKKIS